MNIEAIKTAMLVAKLGSFAAAARSLNVDPSRVSRTVAGLEEELGVRLFQRSTRSLVVSEAGQDYLRRVAQPLEELEQANGAAAGREGPSGTLRLTASVAFAHECIVPHIAAFRVRYPDVTLELVATDANLDLLSNGIDLAIRLTSEPEGELISTRLMRTRYRVCASPDFIRAHGVIAHPRDLQEHDCLRFPLPGYRTQWQFRAGVEPQFAVPVTGHVLISNALLLRQAARDGAGPALLANWLVARDIAAGSLIDLFPDHDCTATTFDTGAWALYPSRAFLPKKVRATIDFLREQLAAGVGSP